AAVTAAANGEHLVTLAISAPGEVRIEAHSLTPANSWSFLNAYAGILGIAERIEDFRATTSSGQDARAKKIATGEFNAELPANKISYKVNVSKPNPGDVSHVSWIAKDYGLLMLADLLPQDFTSVSVRFDLSGTWGVTSLNFGDGYLYRVN